MPQAFDQKMAEFEQATQQAPVRIRPESSEPRRDRRRQAPRLRCTSIPTKSAPCWRRSLGTRRSIRPSSRLQFGSAAPTIKDQQVSFDGDLVHGQFLTEIAGKDVWVTISGHIGEKDGYATFDPTEFKVGDLSVPVSLVNPALQKKLGGTARPAEASG